MVDELSYFGTGITSAISSSNNHVVKALNAEVMALREGLTQILAKAKDADLENYDLQIELEEMRQSLADSERLREETAKTAREELSQLQVDLQTALVTRDEREAENSTLSMTMSQMIAEISELERVW